MSDGVELLADRWAPRAGGEALPTALIRTPYGRRGVFGAAMARPLAERGFQVLIQSTRGGFGSGGTFDPMRQERADGLDTLAWVVKQPWFGGSIVLVGLSYLGYVQWAVADRLPPEVKAMVPQVDVRGRSYNVCDGLTSLSGADEVSRATVRLWPTAHRFKRGHRIRVQVASGAFPRYARNPGTGEPRATATALRAAGQAVYHDPAHQSAVILPVSLEPRA
jgi:predicted acyl esterase